MRIVLATSNGGKLKEIKEALKEFEIVVYSDIMEKFEIKEDGTSYKENALIKARAVQQKLDNCNDIVIADDSGISVPILGNIPGIYSARYAGLGASDKENLQKLINELKDKNIKKTSAFYTAAIAIITLKGEFSVHGWMYGDVIDEARGENGFGYDPMFIPQGYEKTLGELDNSIKKQFSHRSKALFLAKFLISHIL